MNRRLTHLLLAFLLIAALGTRCIASCLQQDRPASSHSCCHQSDQGKQQKPAAEENCEGASYEVQTIEKHAPFLQPTSLARGCEPRVIHGTRLFDPSHRIPPGSPRSYSAVLLI